MGVDVKRLFAEICQDDVFFAYQGEISSDRINMILEETEQKLADASTDLKVKKKIYNIMVECLQNLFHHSEVISRDLTEAAGDKYGMVIVKKHAENFTITVGNFVAADKVKFLTEKIEKINSLSTDELKEMYKFILNYQKLSSKGGGGLGLIDIARKSEEKIDYRFYPYNELYYFYKLDIIVSIKDH